MAALKRVAGFLLVALTALWPVWCMAEEISEKTAEISRPDTAPRKELLERLEVLQRAGAGCVEPTESSDEYLDLLKSVGYYDLLAECLEERLTCNYHGAADRPETWRALGEAWMLSGPQGRPRAHEAFQHALNMKEDDTETRSLLGQLLHREGLYAQADAAYQRTLELDPGNIRARLGRAALLVREGKITEASGIMESAGNAMLPYDVIARLMLRKALYDFENRRGWFEDTGENHSAYARLLYQAGRVTDALLSARRAVDLVPEDYKVWNFIAAMYIQLGTLESGRQAYDKSLEINPNQPQIEAARNQLITQIAPHPQKQ